MGVGAKGDLICSVCTAQHEQAEDQQDRQDQDILGFEVPRCRRKVGFFPVRSRSIVTIKVQVSRWAVPARFHDFLADVDHLLGIKTAVSSLGTPSASNCEILQRFSAFTLARQRQTIHIIIFGDAPIVQRQAFYLCAFLAFTAAHCQSQIFDGLAG
jgi:hypothetical protein